MCRSLIQSRSEVSGQDSTAGGRRERCPSRQNAVLSLQPEVAVRVGRPICDKPAAGWEKLPLSWLMGNRPPTLRKSRPEWGARSFGVHLGKVLAWLTRVKRPEFWCQVALERFSLGCGARTVVPVVSVTTAILLIRGTPMIRGALIWFQMARASAAVGSRITRWEGAPDATTCGQPVDRGRVTFLHRLGQSLLA